MSVKIRLARYGRKKSPYYRMVVADSRRARDGRFIAILGRYQPLNKETPVKVDEEKTLDWLMKGATPSDTCRSILRKQGIMKKFHEMRVATRSGRKNAAPAASPTATPAPVAEEVPDATDTEA